MLEGVAVRCYPFRDPFFFCSLAARPSDDRLLFLCDQTSAWRGKVNPMPKCARDGHRRNHVSGVALARSGGCS
jgi:hypothetical protein